MKKYFNENKIRNDLKILNEIELNIIYNNKFYLKDLNNLIELLEKYNINYEKNLNEMNLNNTYKNKIIYKFNNYIKLIRIIIYKNYEIFY